MYDRTETPIIAIVDTDTQCVVTNISSATTSHPQQQGFYGYGVLKE
jgi:hypothetical protein